MARQYSILSRATCLLLVAAMTLSVRADLALEQLEQRDGSTITVETTQFNPAITNQGGTTNAAGTFNVSPLATSTSYAFQTVVQTSTFQLTGPAAVATANSGGGSSGNSGGDSGGNGNTVIVTATAPATTVDAQPTSDTNSAFSTGASGSGSGSGGSNNGGLPTIALGAQNGGVAVKTDLKAATFVCGLALATTIFGAAILA